MSKKPSVKIERPLDSDTMGRMGESRFGELCDSGNLIANDSCRADRMGWDYLVEFPLPHQRGDVPFDSQSKLPDMKIQVKTIWSDRDAVDINLSAAQRLARWEYPSFVVILRMDMDRTFRDVHVIHLLDDNLARILKALRQAEAKGSLSIKGMTISFGVQHGTRIDVDGQELAHALHAAIGDNPDAYTTRKRDQLRNLGFDPARYTGTVSIAATSEHEMLDVFLGLQAAQCSRFEADEMRFGIPLPQIRTTSANLVIKPQGRPCEVSMTSDVGDRRRAIFEADLYMASTTMTADGLWKIRVQSPLIEMLCTHDNSDAKFTIGVSPETRLRLSEFILLCRAQLIMASGPCTTYVRVDGKPLLSVNMKGRQNPSDSQELRNRLEFLKELEDLLRELNIAQIALNDDDLVSNLDCIHFVLRSQRSANGIVISAKLTPEVSAPQMPDTTDGLFASKITFPDVTIAFWASMHVTARTQGDRVALQCTDFSLRDVAVIRTDQVFEEFVQEASENSGLSFVIRTDTMNWSAYNEQESNVSRAHENNVSGDNVELAP